MKEVGLNNRMSKAIFRDFSNITPTMQGRLRAGVVLLQECGFSYDEACKAVMYYVASDAKDITPSTVNAFSRIISAGLK